MENKDDTVRELMGKLMAHDSEQRNVKQEAMLQTEELTSEIKMLQEQLRMVRELILLKSRLSILPLHSSLRRFCNLLPLRRKLLCCPSE